MKKIRVKVWDEIHAIVAEDGATILQTAIAAGLEPPFNCQIGACTTCKAKLLSGNVVSEDISSLTEDEIRNNYILACQAYASDNDVFIDFDI